MAQANAIRVTVWNEYMDEQKKPEVLAVYPEGMHKTIAAFLNKDSGISAGVSAITDAEQGLAEQVLDNTDVLIWWGHVHHDDVQDLFANRVVDRVQRGMGIIFLHSAHKSKPFMRLLGTSGYLGWREADEKSRVWTAAPSHPIAEGIPPQFLLEKEEMYSEPFGIPEPESTVFISWFEGGNVFRSGLTFQREYGKIFYFQPGHETFPAYHNPHVQRIIANAVKWARPLVKASSMDCPNMEAQKRLAIEMRAELCRELLRKGIHLLIALVPALAALNRSHTALLLMVGILFYSWAEGMRFLGFSPPLISPVTAAVLRKREQHGFALGPVTLGLGALLALLLFPPPVAALAIYVLAFGDSASTIAGKFLGRIRPAFMAGKSLEGSLACFAVAAFIGFLLFKDWQIALAVGLASMLVEALPLEDFDNLLLPLAAGLTAMVKP